MMHKPAIALCYDARLENQAVVVVDSVLRHCQAVDVHVFCTKETDTTDLEVTVNKYPSATLHIKKLDTEQFSGVPTKHWGQPTLYRLLMPALLPDVSRVLYLDCDVVVAGDITPLFDMDMQGKAIGVVTESYSKDWNYGYDLSKESHRHIMKIREQRVYFCSGVVLLDLDKCRNIMTKAACADLLAENFTYPDQDVMNVLFQGQTFILDRTWHTFQGNYQGHANIVHYLGGSKPWKTIPKTAVNKLWWQAAELTIVYEKLVSAFFAGMSVRMQNILRREFN